jgi:hypothetical protein
LLGGTATRFGASSTSVSERDDATVRGTARIGERDADVKVPGERKFLDYAFPSIQAGRGQQTGGRVGWHNSLPMAGTIGFLGWQLIWPTNELP